MMGPGAALSLTLRVRYRAFVSLRRCRIGAIRGRIRGLSLLVRPPLGLVVVGDLFALLIHALVPVGDVLGRGVEVGARSPALRRGSDGELEVIAVFLEATDHRI